MHARGYGYKLVARVRFPYFFSLPVHAARAVCAVALRVTGSGGSRTTGGAQGRGALFAGSEERAPRGGKWNKPRVRTNTEHTFSQHTHGAHP